MDLLTCNGLYKNYGKKEVLKDINLTIPRGKIIGLLGKNGCGKTTLIKTINDLLVPTKGEIRIKGEKIGIEGKKIISYLPERTYLDLNLRVDEVITYFKDFYEDFDQERAHTLLEKLGISSKDHLRTMSKGTREKVQLVLVMSRR
ncbi:MAG: ATP-binding cassette domain-containing protein, partial [Lachnospiraceae bacterium]